MKKLLFLSLVLVSAGLINAAAMYGNRNLSSRTLNSLCRKSFGGTYHSIGKGACASDSGLAWDTNRNLSQSSLSRACRSSFGASYNYIGNGACGSDIG